MKWLKKLLGLDWMNDVILQQRYGLDPEDMRRERIARREADKADGLLGKGLRRFLIGLGVLFLAYIFYSIYFRVKGVFGYQVHTGAIVLFVMMGAVDAVGIVLLWIKEKRTQLIGTVIVCLLTAIYLISPMLFTK